MPLYKNYLYFTILLTNSSICHFVNTVTLDSHIFVHTVSCMFMPLHRSEIET